MEKRDFKRALKDLRAYRRLTEARDLGIEEARTFVIEGEIGLLQGQPGQALKNLRTAERLLKPLGALYDSALVDVYAAKALTALGKNEESLARLKPAIRFFSSEGYALELVHALELWERALSRASADPGPAALSAFDAFRNLHRIVPPPRPS